MSDTKTVEVKYYYRTLKELRSGTPAPFSDPHNFWNAINKNKRDAFLNNVTGYNPDEICQIIALVNGTAAGYLTLFTGYAMINGIVAKVQHGSDLYALPKYRKYMIGAEMLFLARDLQKIPAIFAGLSEFAKPLYPKLGFRLLSYPRYVFIYHTRILVEFSRKIKSPLKKTVAFGLDLLQFYKKNKIYKTSKAIRRRFDIEQTNAFPHNLELLMSKHPCPYHELHNNVWLKYVMNYTFETDAETAKRNKRLYLIKNNGEIIGFFIIKIKDIKVSTGTFKNLRYAEIKEWESANYNLLSEIDIYYLAIDVMKKENVDSIAFASFEKNSQKIISCSFKRQGTYDVAIYFPGSKKNDSIYESTNWRIRDGYSDTLID